MDTVNDYESTVPVIVELPARAGWPMREMTVWARDVLGLSSAEIAGALKVTESTVRRWERGETSPRGRHLAQCDALRDLRALLDAVFTTTDQALIWLRRSPGVPNGVPPLAIIATGSITPLIRVLATLESGAFS